MTRLRSRADRLRLPACLRSTAERLVLPAFGQLTGGHGCGDSCAQWLVADGAIVPWCDPRDQNQGRRVA